MVGPLIVAGLLAWVIMSPGYSRGRGVITLAFLVSVGVLGFFVYWGVFPAWTESWLLYVLLFVIVFPTLWLAAGILVTCWKGYVSRLFPVLCVALWAVVALGFFPFSVPLTSNNGASFVLASLALGALAVLPFVSVTLGLSQDGVREPLAGNNPLQHLRATREGTRRLRAVGVVVLLIAVVALAWIRWPAEPAWIAMWRSQGLPTTLDELNAWYAPVAESQNLAVRYLRAAEKTNQMEAQWLRDAEGSDAASKANTQAASQTYSSAYDTVLAIGYSKVARAEQIPSTVWRGTQRYWELVGREICPDLHAAAHSGLMASRYFIDFRDGFDVQLPHLAKLRQLARLLSLEAWVACVERHPDTAVNDILDIVPIAESLKDEPMFISQLVRIAVHGIACSTLETAMNRVTLSEENLKRLQEGLARELPPIDQGFFLDRGMIGDETMRQAYVYHHGYIHLALGDFTGSPYAGDSSDFLLASTAANAAVPILDVVGFEAFNRLIMNRTSASLREWGRSAARLNSLANRPRFDDIWTEGIQSRAYLALVFMPALGRAYDSEFKIRTELDMARTAVAAERFRLAQGRLPKQLDELVPAFIERTPADPWNDAKPLSYRIKENGEFVVYSWAQNGKDDHGEEEKTGQGWWHGDLTFTVAPPEVRDRPQVAPE